MDSRANFSTTYLFIDPRLRSHPDFLKKTVIDHALAKTRKNHSMQPTLPGVPQQLPGAIGPQVVSLKATTVKTQSDSIVDCPGNRAGRNLFRLKCTGTSWLVACHLRWQIEWYPHLEIESTPLFC
jgi:hypothetical protein